jgi:hypothetical protein
MKVKKEIIVLAAVIVALALYLVLRPTDRTRYELPQLPEVSGKSLSKIEITGPQGTVVLNKADEKWRVEPGDYPADKGKVDEMVETIQNLTLTALISESRDYLRYDLSDDKKVSVKAFGGGELKREFDIGKAGASFRHTYVRLAGDPRVYHARDNFRRKFDQSVGELRDKSVLNFSASDIRQIQLTDAKGQRLLLQRVEAPLAQNKETTGGGKPAQEKAAASPLKAEMVWQTADGRKADADRIDRLLSELSDLKCDSYIENRKKEDFSDAVYTVELKGTQDYNVSVFAKTDESAEKQPAVTSQNAYPFYLPGWRAEQIMPGFDTLIQKEDASAKAPQKK